MAAERCSNRRARCLCDITAVVVLAGLLLMSHISGLVGNEAEFFQEGRVRGAWSRKKLVDIHFLSSSLIKAAQLFLFSHFTFIKLDSLKTFNRL